MTPRLQTSRTNPLARRLLPAALLVFGLGWQVQAMASSAPTVSADDHARYCKCANCRGASCCCGARGSKVVETPPTPAASPVRVDDGPCVNPSPCGDPVLPGSAPAGHVGKVTALAPRGHLIAATAGLLIDPRGRCVLPSRRASRLDDPPESPPLP